MSDVDDDAIAEYLVSEMLIKKITDALSKKEKIQP